MKTLALTLAFALAATLAFSSPASADDKKSEKADSVLDFKVNDIDGNPVDLSGYKGKVLLIVNTASRCGNTPQYNNLEQVYQKYKDQGLTVLAFPANEFGKQEPGSNEDIKEFCSTRYKVSFPLFSKIVVKGEGQHPLYEYLTKQTDFKGDITWNFEKFLVSRDGKVVARISPKTKPDDAKVIEKIETELAKK